MEAIVEQVSELCPDAMVEHVVGASMLTLCGRCDRACHGRWHATVADPVGIGGQSAMDASVKD